MVLNLYLTSEWSQSKSDFVMLCFKNLIIIILIKVMKDFKSDSNQCWTLL